MNERRRYTKRQKAEAVGLSVVSGKSEAARRTGIPRKTIAYWAEDPEFAALRQRKKEEVALDVWAAFQKGVERVKELIPTTDDALKVATASGILFDKFALMSGDATARTEHREILHDFADGEKEALEQWLHEIAKERAGAA